MKYYILTAGSPGELQNYVQAQVDNGWRPVGGVCVSVLKERNGYGDTYESLWYHQALVSAPRRKWWPF
jgi:hypothetical protein